MKNLIYKQLKLTIHPALFLYSLLTVLLLIPEYPKTIAMIYVIFSIQIVFGISKSNKDLEFTAMLPVSRKDVVLSMHFTAVILQLVHVLMAIPFALISVFWISKNGNPVGLDCNFTFFGVSLISYGVFNLVLLPQFFKSGYKSGIPLVLASGAYAVVVVAFELLIAFVPVLNEKLDGLKSQSLVFQIAFLLLGIATYCLAVLISLKLSVKNFEKVSL